MFTVSSLWILVWSGLSDSKMTTTTMTSLVTAAADLFVVVVESRWWRHDSDVIQLLLPSVRCDLYRYAFIQALFLKFIQDLFLYFFFYLQITFIFYFHFIIELCKQFSRFVSALYRKRIQYNKKLIPNIVYRIPSYFKPWFRCYPGFVLPNQSSLPKLAMLFSLVSPKLTIKALKGFVCVKRRRLHVYRIIA